MTVRAGRSALNCPFLGSFLCIKALEGVVSVLESEYHPWISPRRVSFCGFFEAPQSCVQFCIPPGTGLVLVSAIYTTQRTK